MSYTQLRQTFTRLQTLRDVSGVLGWDMQTYMPAGGSEARGKQLAELRMMQNELIRDERMGEWFDAAAEDASLGAWERANVHEMRRTWQREVAVEPALVRQLAVAGTRCYQLWTTARPANDWAALLPHFSEVLALTREVAVARGEAAGLSPYDALVDAFTPGMTAAAIEAVFAPLRASLPQLLDDVLEAQAARPAPHPLEGPFTEDAQAELAKTLMRAIGFDFEHGRLDVSAHPFCGGIPSDVRITTRYRNDEFLSGLMGVLHETGHAMYERQLPDEWASQPVGSARGMGLHESQSLLVEMQVCASTPFLRFAVPHMKRAFGKEGPAWTVENVLRHCTRVERGLIRVDADEVSYPLHVILRFDIERQLIDGSLEPADLPEAWRAAMETLVGVAPPDDKDGCMQDIHWMDGAYGYFPAYSLGAIAANQLYAAARESVPTMETSIEAGDFGPLMGWLRQHVHGLASSVSGPAILEAASGRSYDPDAYLTHLRQRYVS